MMEENSLTLTVEKGPREGESLVRNPGSTVRIGRLVKGNTFSIKDSGISSHHMLIEFKDAKWVVSDLGSSNGTLLNGIKLQALVTYDLRDGDLIKIGEYTSIKLNIREVSKVDNPSKRDAKGASVEDLDGLGAENGESQVRRNPRRKAAPAPKKVAAVVPDSDAVVAENGESLVRRNPRRKAAAASKKVPTEVPVDHVPEVQTIPEKSNLAAEEDHYEAKILPPLRGRGRRRGAAARTEALKDGEPLESSMVQEIPGNSNVGQERGRDQADAITVGENKTGQTDAKNQHTGSGSVVHKISENSNLGGESCREAADVAPLVEDKPRTAVSRRRTRSSGDNDKPPDLVLALPEIPEDTCSAQENCIEPGNKVNVQEKREEGEADAQLGVSNSEDEVLAPVQAPASDAHLGLSNSEKNTYKESNEELKSVVSVAENKTRRCAQKRTRASKTRPAGSVYEVQNFTKCPNVIQESSSEPENAVPVKQKLRQQAIVRTRSSKDGDEPSASVSVSEVPDIPESSNLRQGSCGELENGVNIEDKAGQVTLEGIKATKDAVQPGGLNSQKDSNKEPMSTNDVNENHIKIDCGKELEKMTLGEWFDHMEVYLSNQIYDTTEEIILGMRERARKFNEFMSQHQNGKAKQPAV